MGIRLEHIAWSLVLILTCTTSVLSYREWQRWGEDSLVITVEDLVMEVGELQAKVETLEEETEKNVAYRKLSEKAHEQTYMNVENLKVIQKYLVDLIRQVRFLRSQPTVPFNPAEVFPDEEEGEKGDGEAEKAI